MSVCDACFLREWGMCVVDRGLVGLCGVCGFGVWFVGLESLTDCPWVMSPCWSIAGRIVIVSFCYVMIRFGLRLGACSGGLGCCSVPLVWSSLSCSCGEVRVDWIGVLNLRV